MTNIQAPPASGTYPTTTAHAWKRRESDPHVAPHPTHAGEPEPHRATSNGARRPEPSPEAAAAATQPDATAAGIAKSPQEQRPRTLQSTLRETDLSRALQAFRNLKQGVPDAARVEHAAVPVEPETDGGSTAPTTAARGSSHADPFSRVSQDLQALQAALQAGDLSGAQRAFATFQHDLHAVGHPHDFLNAHGRRHSGVRNRAGEPCRSAGGGAGSPGLSAFPGIVWRPAARGPGGC
jgi:hypothetical protein